MTSERAPGVVPTGPAWRTGVAAALAANRCAPADPANAGIALCVIADHGPRKV